MAPEDSDTASSDDPENDDPEQPLQQNSDEEGKSEMEPEERDELDKIDARIHRGEQQATLEREKKQIATIQAIINTTFMFNMYHVMQREIDRDWLVEVKSPIRGNIYRWMAFGSLRTSRRKGECSLSCARVIGYLLIFLTQLVAPPIIAYSSVKGRPGMVAEGNLAWSSSALTLDGWDRDSAPSKLLCTLIIFIFIMNGLFVTTRESTTWGRLHQLFHILNNKNYKKGMYLWALYVDAFMSMYVVLFTSFDVYAVMIGTESAMDALLKGFSLLLLYNLAGIGGMLGFLDDGDWHGDELAWILEFIVNQRRAATHAHRRGARSQKSGGGWDLPGRPMCVTFTFEVVRSLLCMMLISLPALFAFKCVAPS
jgi:hypothetical protein